MLLFFQTMCCKTRCKFDRGSVPTASVAGQLLEQAVEVGEVRILDDHTPAAVFVLDANLEAKGALELLLHLLHIWIDNGFRLGLLLVFLRKEDALYQRFCLANIKRKIGDPLRRLFKRWMQLQSQQHFSVPKAKLAGFDKLLSALRQA